MDSNIAMEMDDNKDGQLLKLPDDCKEALSGDFDHAHEEACSSSSIEVQGRYLNWLHTSAQAIHCYKYTCLINLIIYICFSTAGDVDDNVNEIEREFAYDLLGNGVEGNK